MPPEVALPASLPVSFSLSLSLCLALSFSLCLFVCLALSLSHQHSLSLAPVVMIYPKERKAKISLTHSLILSFSSASLVLC